MYFHYHTTDFYTWTAMNYHYSKLVKIPNEIIAIMFLFLKFIANFRTFFLRLRIRIWWFESNLGWSGEKFHAGFYVTYRNIVKYDRLFSIRNTNWRSARRVNDWDSPGFYLSKYGNGEIYFKRHLIEDVHEEFSIEVTDLQLNWFLSVQKLARAIE